MIQIELEGNKFRVSVVEDCFGNFSCPAATAAEAAQAVIHYYGNRDGCSENSCPFCRTVDRAFQTDAALEAAGND